MADHTKYDFNGKKSLHKNRMVFEVVKKFVEDNPNVSLIELQRVFNRQLQGGMEVVEKKQNLSGDKLRRYFIKNNEIISLSNGDKIAVTTEWSMGNIHKFLKKSQELGYEIKESTENEGFFPDLTDKYDSIKQTESDLPTSDEYLFAFIKFFSKESGNSENQKKILQFHLSQQNYSTTARIITENLGLTNIGHANMLCGHLAKGLCQILGKENLRYFVEILFNFKKTNEFNNELQWILHLPVVEALNKFFSMSEEEMAEFVKNFEQKKPVFKKNISNYPLNLILYGPPGTGKTYNTINKALQIIDGDFPENRTDCEKRFAELKQAGQIEFITFHQSYSYEDFVEGIKPDISEESDQMKFRLNDGIFKKICDVAETNLKLATSQNQNKYPFEKIWTLFMKDVDFSLEEEKKVQMKTTSFFIYDFNDTTIRFRKKVGKSVHTLSFSTLKKMFYAGENKIISGGLEPYYSALLSQLLKINSNTKDVSHELKNHVLIIDEINRGNISRIFGELITLIEEDKRDGKLTAKLPYSQEDFTVPSNLFIIGTMNTADRSIALLDIALRRRFTFFRFDPDSSLVNFVKAKNIMEKLNSEIVKSKGKDFQIGHSYFMKVNSDEELKTVLKYKIKPLLEEYFVNDSNKLENLIKLIDEGI